ncbi:collagen-like protein [Nocardioides sp. SR21]|uniref:collagen-like protein n=1 Tax=Nocardioides sp. SR21 TaxID=2919501 RepID=UPI001FAB12BD|nr:collagen-like protein [Nocardioides sp. SR21]
MIAVRRSRLTTIAAATAVVLLAGGTGAVARSMVGTADIQNDAITSAKIRDGAVRSNDLAAGVVTKGDKGEKGDSGAQGPQGEVGPQGATGPQGAAGLNGSQGPRGLAGQVGPQGPKGDQGETGAPGGFAFSGDSSSVAPHEDIAVTTGCFEGSDPNIQVVSLRNEDLRIVGQVTVNDSQQGVVATPTQVDATTSYWSPMYPAGTLVTFDLTVVSPGHRSYVVHAVITPACQGQGTLIPMG